jgi:hypothetical protein
MATSASNPMPGLAASDPMPGRAVRIYVSRDISYNLEKMNRITAQVLGRLGCGGCHSGRILHFVALEDFIVNPKTLDVHEVGFGELHA